MKTGYRLIKRDILKLKQSEQSEQSDQSEQSSNDYKYSSFGSHLYKLSKKLQNTSLKLDDDSSDSNISLLTPKKGTGLKILTPKQMLQRLSIAPAQVTAGNNS